MPLSLFLRAVTLSVALLAVALALAPAGAQMLYKEPSLGFTQPNLPRVAPPVATGPVRTVPPVTPKPFVANQCQLAAGTCPLGRLQRSGNRCYCVTTGGAARQGSSQVKPQGANPSSQ